MKTEADRNPQKSPELPDKELQQVTGGTEEGWAELPKSVSLSLCKCKSFRLRETLPQITGMPGGCAQCQSCTGRGRVSYCMAGHTPTIFS